MVKYARTCTTKLDLIIRLQSLRGLQNPIKTRAQKIKSAQRPKFYGTVVANFGTALAITDL